jgi:hypothetical protein
MLPERPGLPVREEHRKKRSITMLNSMKRLALGAIVGLSLTGGSLATFAVGHAAATDPASAGMSSTNEYVCERIQGRWFCYEL